MKHHSVIPFYIALGMQFVSCLFIMWFAWLYFIPVNVIKPNQQPYQVLTKTVHVGDPLIYVVDACKYRDIKSVVARTFVEEKKQTLYPAISEINRVRTGCNKTDVSITVPNNILPGHYHLELDVSYKINFLREEIYHFQTEDFEVMAK